MGSAFKEILKEFLQENNLTQKAFADKIGVKPTLVCDWLKGESNPSYFNIRAMAQAFNISADYFLGITDSY